MWELLGNGPEPMEDGGRPQRRAGPFHSPPRGASFWSGRGLTPRPFTVPISSASLRARLHLGAEEANKEGAKKNETLSGGPALGGQRGAW